MRDEEQARMVRDHEEARSRLTTVAVTTSANMQNLPATCFITNSKKIIIVPLGEYESESESSRSGTFFRETVPNRPIKIT